MSRRPAIAAHLRRYPWWYGVAAVWVVAMLALPIVHLGPLQAAADGRTTTGTGVVAPPADGTALPPGVGAGSFFPPGGGPTSTAGGADRAAGGGSGATTTTVPAALSLVPPELLDLVLNAIPQVVLPPLPDELAPIARALAPVAATGCSGLGLASVVVAVVAQSANGVPVQRILPYLSPLSTACASFPIPPHHTVCAADPPFVVDLGGLTSTPPILGLGIDEVEATQTLLSQTFGQALPDLAAAMRVQLDCTVT